MLIGEGNALVSNDHVAKQI